MIREEYPINNLDIFALGKITVKEYQASDIPQGSKSLIFPLLVQNILADVILF